MDALKLALSEESPYKLSDEIMDEFCSYMVEKRCKKNEILIDCGSFNDNIYIVKEGIFCQSHLDGNKERVTAFATPGTIIISWHSFCHRLPPYIQVSACCTSSVMVVEKSKFEHLINKSKEFSLWVNYLNFEQLYLYEMKNRVINGTALERYRSLLKNRPIILQKVPLRIIAQYLGITSIYLSKLRRLDIKNSKETT